MTVTQHHAKVWLTGDLAIEFSVFDHNSSQVPDKVWDEFVLAYHHAHGSDPANSLREYVIDSNWLWEDALTDGAVVVDEADSPLCLETEPVGPEGCRIVFWDEGNVYDTGLRVWTEEAEVVARLLREKTVRERAQ